MLPQRYVFSSKSQHAKFPYTLPLRCYCYHKGTYFQANHNGNVCKSLRYSVVIATTKVRIFKQITTASFEGIKGVWLLLLPQRYVFSSKSQLLTLPLLVLQRCYCYHKGTYFQANHNTLSSTLCIRLVVIATTKVRIFKQITTRNLMHLTKRWLLLLPQRYVFSSKSQP